MAGRQALADPIWVASDAVIELTWFPTSAFVSSLRWRPESARSTAWRAARHASVGNGRPGHQRQDDVVEFDAERVLTALALASSTRVPVTRRCGDTGALNRVLGARSIAPVCRPHPRRDLLTHRFAPA